MDKIEFNRDIKEFHTYQIKTTLVNDITHSFDYDEEYENSMVQYIINQINNEIINNIK